MYSDAFIVFALNPGIPGSETLTSVGEIGVNVGAAGVCKEPSPIVVKLTFEEVLVTNWPVDEETETFAVYVVLADKPAQSYVDPGLTVRFVQLGALITLSFAIILLLSYPEIEGTLIFTVIDALEAV